MLPRPVVTLVVLLLTAGELVNIVAQAFFAGGDTAVHVMYPAALAALGVTAAVRRPPDPPADAPAGAELPGAATDLLDADTDPMLPRHPDPDRKGSS